jgi:hypothetical protein
MDGESVKALERIIAQSMFVDVDGMKFGRNGDGDIAPILYDPRPEKLFLQTLTGFVDYIKSNVDKINLKDHLVVVDSHLEVALLSALSGVTRGRDWPVIARVDPGLSVYKFGEYQSVESFIVSLNSLFEESHDRERLTAYVSRVHGGESLTLEDDGVTQIASVSTRVSGALTEKESAPKIVYLKPYRTFRDVYQPESAFLFRMKLFSEQDKTVGACLYEADGGRWRNTAIQAIKEFLKEELIELGVSIIA